MTEHIMANVYEAQRLAKELRRAIAAARWEIADDTRKLRLVLSTRDASTEDERILGWNLDADTNLYSSMVMLDGMTKIIGNIRDDAH